MESNRYCFFDPRSESLFYCGLDLGQVKDYTASSVIERRPGFPAVYHIRNLKRFELGTSYPAIVDQIKTAIDNPAIKPNLLFVDSTGVGMAVADMIKQVIPHFYAVIITAGDTVNAHGRILKVPKKDLISALMVVLQTRRLKIPNLLPEAQLLLEEMTNFQVRISSSGHSSFGVWREGIHDDLLLSVALACWGAEKKFLPHAIRWPRAVTGRRPTPDCGVLSGDRLTHIVTEYPLTFHL